MSKKKRTSGEKCTSILGLSFNLIFMFLISIPSNVFCQNIFHRWDSLQASASSNTFLNPWAGGFNNPQFSEIDLDGDGQKDVFVFDRSNERIYTFISENLSGVNAYVHRPEFEQAFPELHHWALLADYNCDGREDIFTATEEGIKVYRNDLTITDGLKFTLVSSQLMALQNSVWLGLYVSQWDLPAISDVDNDGDLDILTFEILGFTMQFYRNTSIETYGVCDSLRYAMADNCYGGFREAFGNCSVQLGVSCKRGTAPGSSRMHAGSTTLATDLDGDGDKELIIGDLSCNTAYMLTNGGDSLLADFISSDSLYPPSLPINLHKFVACFSMDVTFDGKKDLLVAPNALKISENFNSVFLYENTGTNELPQFTFTTNSFLQNEMIDVGEVSYPTFFYYDSDTLPDMAIGNYGYFTQMGDFESGIAVFRNSGTAQQPSFNLITRDFAALKSLNLNAVYPAFGDLDNDGDQDMIIGESEGKLHYFTNTAGAGNLAVYVLSIPEYKGIDVGQYSAPQLVDVNRDGLTDLLVGEKDGNLNYYENIGSKENANYSTADDHFGGVNVKRSSDVDGGFSSPALGMFDSTGNYCLFVGSASGRVYQYADIDNNLNGTFTLEDSSFQDIFEGRRSALGIGDINHDGATDFAVGNLAGGVAIYRNSGSASPPPPQIIGEFSVAIGPVPSHGSVQIKIEGVEWGEVASVQLFNVIGQKMVETSYGVTNQPIRLDIGPLAIGMYVFRIRISDKEVIEKILVIKP